MTTGEPSFTYPHPYAITFSGDAGETFQTFVTWIGERGYTVELTDHEGREHTATLIGPDHASEWYDAVLYHPYDETGRFEQEETRSVRVQSVHVV